MDELHSQGDDEEGADNSLSTEHSKASGRELSPPGKNETSQEYKKNAGNAIARIMNA